MQWLTLQPAAWRQILSTRMTRIEYYKLDALVGVREKVTGRKSFSYLKDRLYEYFRDGNG